MKLKIIYTVLFGLCSTWLMAQQNKAQVSSATVRISSGKNIDTTGKKGSGILIDKLLKSAVCKKGLFNIYVSGNQYYFEIPDSILKRELLLTNFLVKVPGGSPKYGGEQLSSKTICFEKGLNNKIVMRIVENIFKSDSVNTIAKAVDNSNINPISMVFDIKGAGKDGKSTIIEATNFLEKENIFTALPQQLKSVLRLSAIAADKSYISSVASYPINVELKMVRTYKASGAATPARPGQPATPALDAAKIGEAITLELSTSILLMPEKPMMPRLADNRVGYFTDSYFPFSDTQQDMNFKSFIVRYRLEPKPEDIAKYKRGELVEPKQQIVYYIDPATPKKWVPYLIAGINDWNEAFKAAGFKNAIVGKEWPANDTTMSLEDARYKVLRYLPSATANAYGPHIEDPRSGEILQDYIGWYHNVMSLVHDWYMIQAGPNDPRARKMVFDDDLMGTLIRFVSSHEVGHTLGLLHNMGSSSLTPVEKLRDKKWVEAHGHTNSIMDYARFNYVAQPEDSIGQAGIMPRINDYDKWAIKWGYSYTGATDAEADKKIVSQWVTDSLKANPRLWFGDERSISDARAQTEDVGDDNMKASEYGIKNLKYVMAHLPEWTKEENDLYTNLTEMYLQLATQYRRYALHVAKNVGSVYQNYKTPDEPGDIFSPEPVEKQKEAVAFLNKYVFETPTWLLDENILNKIGNPEHMSAVANVQKTILMQVTADRVFNSLDLMEQRFGKSKTYSMTDYLSDLKGGIWSELNTHKNIDIFRRQLQKEYVFDMMRALNEAELGNNAMGLLFGGSEELTPLTLNTDIGSLLAVHLQNLRKDILTAIPATTDKISKEHLEFVADQIKDGLDQRFDKSLGKR